MENNLPMTTYVSPRTGTEYLIVPKQSWYMTFDGKGGSARKYFTKYEIVLNGNPVQFALSEETIPDQVRHFEQPGWDGWTTSPRD